MDDAALPMTIRAVLVSTRSAVRYFGPDDPRRAAAIRRGLSLLAEVELRDRALDGDGMTRPSRAAYDAARRQLTEMLSGEQPARGADARTSRP